MEHSKAPRNYYVMSDASHQAEGWNRLCGDRVTVYLKLAADKVEKASFSGESCAICKASASMLMERLPGLSVTELEELVTFLERYSETWQADENKIGSFASFQLMKTYPTRLKCLRLPWRTTGAALRAETKQVSTEDDDS